MLYAAAPLSNPTASDNPPVCGSESGVTINAAICHARPAFTCNSSRRSRIYRVTCVVENAGPGTFELAYDEAPSPPIGGAATVTPELPKLRTYKDLKKRENMLLMLVGLGSSGALGPHAHKFLACMAAAQKGPKVPVPAMRCKTLTSRFCCTPLRLPAL